MMLNYLAVVFQFIKLMSHDLTTHTLLGIFEEGLQGMRINEDDICATHFQEREYEAVANVSVRRVWGLVKTMATFRLQEGGSCPGYMD